VLRDLDQERARAREALEAKSITPDLNVRGARRRQGLVHNFVSVKFAERMYCMTPDAKHLVAYEPPALRVLGSVQTLTQGCDKHLGSSDGFTFVGQAIVCASG
jgi:hypothetical protein